MISTNLHRFHKLPRSTTSSFAIFAPQVHPWPPPLRFRILILTSLHVLPLLSLSSFIHSASPIHHFLFHHSEYWPLTLHHCHHVVACFSSSTLQVSLPFSLDSWCSFHQSSIVTVSLLAFPLPPCKYIHDFFPPSFWTLTPPSPHVPPCRHLSFIIGAASRIHHGPSSFEYWLLPSLCCCLTLVFRFAKLFCSFLLPPFLSWFLIPTSPKFYHLITTLLLVFLLPLRKYTYSSLCLLILTYGSSTHHLVGHFALALPISYCPRFCFPSLQAHPSSLLILHTNVYQSPRTHLIAYCLVSPSTTVVPLHGHVHHIPLLVSPSSPSWVLPSSVILMGWASTSLSRRTLGWHRCTLIISFADIS